MDPASNDSIATAAKQQLEKLFPEDQNSIVTIDQITNASHNCGNTSDFEISFSTISRVISKLKDEKSPGHDNISNQLVKFIFKKFPDLIHKLFNKCLELGVFPKHFKIGKVILILKKRQTPLIYQILSPYPTTANNWESS